MLRYESKIIKVERSRMKIFCQRRKEVTAMTACSHPKEVNIMLILCVLLQCHCVSERPWCWTGSADMLGLRISGTQEDRRLFLKLLEDARTEAVRCGATVDEVGPAGSPGIAFWTFIHLLRLLQTKQLDLHFHTLQDNWLLSVGSLAHSLYANMYTYIYCNQFMIIA